MHTSGWARGLSPRSLPRVGDQYGIVTNPVWARLTVLPQWTQRTPGLPRPRMRERVRRYLRAYASRARKQDSTTRQKGWDAVHGVLEGSVAVPSPASAPSPPPYMPHSAAAAVISVPHGLQKSRWTSRTAVMRSRHQGMQHSESRRRTPVWHIIGQIRAVRNRVLSRSL